MMLEDLEQLCAVWALMHSQSQAVLSAAEDLVPVLEPLQKGLREEEPH